MATAVRMAGPAPLDRAPLAAADPLEAILRELVAEVRGLRADLARQPRASTLTREDRARLAAILPAAGGVFGPELFLTRDLFASESAALQLVLDGLTAKQLGRLFRRADGQAIDGYLIQRDGSELNTALWRIVAVHGFLEVSNRTVPPLATDGRR